MGNSGNADEKIKGAFRGEPVTLPWRRVKVRNLKKFLGVPDDHELVIRGPEGSQFLSPDETIELDENVNLADVPKFKWGCPQPLVNEDLKDLTCEKVEKLLQNDNLSGREKFAIIRHATSPKRCTTGTCGDKLIEWEEKHRGW